MELMISKLLGFVMIMTRIAAFFVSAPVFSWKTIPPRVKAAMVFLLAIFFSMITPLPINTNDVATIRAVILIATEALYGLALGLIAASLFCVVRVTGRIVERQMGLARAQVMDPFVGERVQPLGVILEMIFVLLFLAANGHHLLLLTLSKSYETFPPGTIPSVAVLATGAVEAGSAMLLAALRLAAPILAAFIIIMVVLAILARSIPEMNILFISLPLRVGIGLLMAAFFLPYINSFVAEFADWMNKLLPL